MQGAVNMSEGTKMRTIHLWAAGVERRGREAQEKQKEEDEKQEGLQADV